MADIKDRAREYLAKNSEYNEVYGEFFVAVDTMTAMIEFAEQETKELKEQIERLSKHILELQKDKGNLTDRVKELEAQIEKMKAELHHRLISPSHDDSDCLDKIIGLDRLWQFGQEF